MKSGGFGAHWEHTRIFNGQNGSFESGQGTGWMVFRWPYAVKNSADNSIAVVRGTQGSLWFNPGPMRYEARYGALSDLKHFVFTDIYTLTLPCGTKLDFNGFTQTTYPPGSFAKETSPGGLETTVDSYTTDGQIAGVSRSSAKGTDTLTENFAFTYNTDLRLTNVLLRRRVNTGSWDDVRQVNYEYYGSSDSHGLEGDLKTVTVQAPGSSGWDDIDITLYRYWISNTSPGYEHGLKYVLNPAGYDPAEL